MDGKATGDKVKVKITATQTIYYDQTVEMPLSEWQAMQSMSPEEVAQQLDGGWLDTRNIDEAEPIDPDDFCMYLLDDDGKIKEEYDGAGSAEDAE